MPAACLPRNHACKPKSASRSTADGSGVLGFDELFVQDFCQQEQRLSATVTTTPQGRGIAAQTGTARKWFGLSYFRPDQTVPVRPRTAVTSIGFAELRSARTHRPS